MLIFSKKYLLLFFLFNLKFIYKLQSFSHKINFFHLFIFIFFYNNKKKYFKNKILLNEKNEFFKALKKT